MYLGRMLNVVTTARARDEVVQAGGRMMATVLQPVNAGTAATAAARSRL